ncbi:MAG: hypothetical protein HYU37_09955 [Acidobacteria bacterium]|nr:hypothetical protein [Acidobacteriota bacterium]
MAYLKTDAPADVVETLRQLEAQADECWRALQIRYNLSNTSVKWAIGHGQPATAALSRRWTGELSTAVDQAISAAADYSHFEVCFQGFHKDRYAADVLAPSLIRFTVPGVERDRQVSAYQKGMRPREGRFAGQRAAQPPQAPRVAEAFERVLRGCRQTGSLSFEYGEPWDLWRALLPECRDRVKALARRADTLSLGPYRLDEFNELYVALIAVCAAHDHLCFRWAQAQRVYPVESAVMVRPVQEWADVLSKLSGVAPEKCRAMLSDLTFSVKQSVDLHVYPFIPLNGMNEMLALAPPFPLHSRHDENILRVCSQRRQQIYDVTSLEKQSEMLAAARVAGRRYGADGPIQLPNPVPDIDLLAVDESSSTVVIAELKWIRKTVRALEIPDRDADVLKGIGQLEAIRAFLADNPDYLSSRGLLPRPINQFEHVHYLLVARDHWRWVEPHDGIAIVEFEPFARVLEQSNNLRDAAGELLTYDWLPVEGRDFNIQYDAATANGVRIESPVFYSAALS